MHTVLPTALALALAPVLAPPVAVEGDSPRAAAAAQTVDALEELAEECQRDRNYGARDRAYALVLVVDPEHTKARKTLRYLKVRGEGWVQSEQYRTPRDRDPESMADFPQRLEAAVRPFATWALEELRAGRDSLGPDEARDLAASVDALLAPDAPARGELRALWDADRGAYRRAEPPPAAEADGSTLEGRPAGPTFELEGRELTVDLAGLGVPLVEVPEPGERAGRWRGLLGGSELEASLYVVERPGDGLWFPAESEDVVEELEVRVGRRKDDEWPGYYFRSSELVPGGASASAYTTVVRGELREGRKPDEGEEVPGEAFLVGGCLERGGYALAVECRPAPDEAGAERLLGWLREAPRYSGPSRDPRWTDAEAWARWREFAPSSAVEDMEEIVRTEHFIILGNSDSGKRFAEKMEECYETVREIYPFEEVPGRRLLPVFLFRTRDQYNRYYARIAGTSVGAAARSGGHAWRDYYATWYEAPQDPVHVHEVTHQVFGNRLRLNGGGSWFQEGVAEYVETRENQRGNAARDVRKRRHLPLRKFVRIPSLLMSTSEGVKGGNRAGDYYKTAALLVEFLRESEWGREGFVEFVRRVGRVPRGDVRRIEAVVRDVYGTDLEGLEDAWVEYCERR